MLKTMSASLILYEKITTTGKKAKLIKSEVEKLITKGKTDTLHSKRMLFARLPKNAAKKVFEILGPKYRDRAGGYVRLARVGVHKDRTSKVRLELI
ncbi:MAG: 50S ribosomal protein L17 [Candidatus Doudnabacteria bacterium]|nr:50S ribosomal protein L17 [Candidatus Doudnabacteria bacterium]